MKDPDNPFVEPSEDYLSFKTKLIFSHYLGTGALKVGREPERLRYSKEVSMATKTLPAAEKICRSQSVRSTRARGRPSCNMKRGPGAHPRTER